MTDTSTSPTDSGLDDPTILKMRLEVEYLRRQNEKLSFEIDDAKSESAGIRQLRKMLPLITGLVAVAGFWFGIIQYVRAEAASRGQRETADKARLEQEKAADEVFRRDLKRETAKPLWDRQLSLYIEATEKAAIIATTDDETRRTEAEARFWVLYWGPLAAVEDVGMTKQTKAEIEQKMVEFGRLLESRPARREQSKLTTACLALAHAVRDAVAPAFDVEATKLAGLREAEK